jgi:hypothetical protein
LLMQPTQAVWGSMKSTYGCLWKSLSYKERAWLTCTREHYISWLSSARAPPYGVINKAARFCARAIADGNHCGDGRCRANLLRRAHLCNSVRERLPHQIIELRLVVQVGRFWTLSCILGQMFSDPQVHGVDEHVEQQRTLGAACLIIQ